MISRRPISRLVSALALAVASIATTGRGVAQQADPFSITPFADQAIFSCEDAQVNGTTNSTGGTATNQGHVLSNGRITVNGGAQVNGNATPGPGQTVSGSGTVTGSKTAAATATSCTPVANLPGLVSTLQAQNDNGRLSTLNPNPLQGTNFVLNGGQSVTLPAGTYYFTQFTINGGATLTLLGMTKILVNGSVTVSGQVNSGNPGYNPSNLRILTTGNFSLNGGAFIRAYVYVPNQNVAISSNLTGGLFAKRVTVNSGASVTRWLGQKDFGPPTVTITSPANGSAPADLSAVSVTGTVSDPDGAATVAVKVNGSSALVTPGNPATSGSFSASVNMLGVQPPVITAEATDLAVQTATQSVTLCGPPTVALTSPASGDTVATRTVTLMGSAGNATAVTVNGLPVTTLSNGTFTFSSFDLGATQGAKTLTIVATGPCGSTTITAVITYSTAPPDRFALQSWMTDQAVFARQSVLVDNGARVSSLGSGTNGAPTNQGHVISNGTITVGNNAVVDGNALAGPPPSPAPTVQNNGQVTGTKGNLAVARTEFPVDLAALTTQVQAQNNNGTIPRTGQNRDPLEGAGHTEFRLQNNDSLTLPAGTYYFTKLTIDNNAALTVSGRVNILCTGQVTLSNNVNHQAPVASPFNIRLWASGTADVNLGNNLTLGAFVYAPNAKVVLDNNATLVGGIFAKSVEVRNNGFVKRRLDSGPPTLTILEPANGATPANPAAVRVRGTATDTDSPVVVTINGAPVGLASGAFDTTVDVRTLNPAVLTVVATDSIGNTDVKTISLNVCSVGPVVTLTSPGPFAKTRVVAVQGTCGAASTVTVNGQNATVTGGTFSLSSLDLGAGDGAKTLTVVATATGCPPTTQPFTVTLDTIVPTVAIDTPSGGATLTSSPTTVGGPASDANLLSVTVNGVTTTTFTGGRFSVAVPLTSGSNTLVATALDRAGNATTSNSVAVTYTPSGSSSVSIDPPATALVATKRITVTGSYSGPVQSITVLGVPAQLGVPSAGRFTAANVELQEGPQPVKAIATETGGTQTPSAAVTWELDSMPPTVTIDTPALSPACRGASPSITLSGKYADLHAATTNAVSVEIRPSGGGAAVTQVAVVDAATGRWTLTGASLGTADGNATVTVTAKDSLNQKTTSIASWRIDSVTPTVSLLLDGAPFPGSAAGAAPPAGTAPTLFGRIVTVRASVQDGAQATPPAAVLTLDGQPYVEGTPIATEGDHTVVARATDCAAHEGNAYAYFRIDRTGPQLTSTTPAEAAKVSTAVTTYSGTADTPLASVKLNGADATVNGSGFSLTPFPWKEGLNRVTVDLKDAAGNETSYSRTFTVKTLSPKLEILESGLPLKTGTTFFRSVTPTLRSDDPDATVTATLDGQPYTSGTAISAAGGHTLIGTARDSVSHADTQTVAFTVDLSAGPTIAISSPAEAAVLGGSTVTVTGTTGASTTGITVNGRAAIPAGGAWTVTGVPLETDLPTDLVAVARDAQGRTATATRTVLSRSSGPRILILEPSVGFSTNRGKIDVAGAIVGGPSFTANGTVTVTPQGAAAITAPLDVTGAFRVRDVPLVDGANTITVSATDAQGRTSSQTVTGGIDRTPPTVAVTVNGQPLAEGSQFSFAVTLRIQVSDNAAPVPTPTIRLNGEEKPASSPATDVAISQAGGYVVTVVARDSVGNETRVSRSFVVDLGGCTLTDIDPADAGAVASASFNLRGRSGTAASIAVRVPNPGTTPVTYTDYAAQVADGTFAVADVPLPAVGDNALQIVCTDRSGQSHSQTHTIRRLPQGGGPSLSFTAPTTGARVSTQTIAIAGTISDPAASVFVNGLAVVVNGSGAFNTTSTVVDGPNVLSAHGVDAAGRTADARVVVFRDTQAPRVQITSPQNEQRIGPLGAAPLRVDVTGTVEVETEPNLATVTTQTAAGTVTATVDANTGVFRAADVPLSPTTAPQTVTVTAVDTLGQSSQVTLTVLADPQGPAIRLTQPQDLTRYNATSPATVAVTGEAWATTGAQISVNGGTVDPATLAWSAAGPDGRRSATFGAQIPVPATDGAFGVIARVEQPGGKVANDKRLLAKDATAPSALELVPTNGAAQVDPNAILLALFSEPVRKDSLSSANGLILTRVGTTEPVAGTYTVAGNAVAFAPGAALQRGQAYRFKAGAGITDYAGVALSAEVQVTFTVALSSTETAPTLDPIPAVLCANTLHVKGGTVPGATVKIRDGDLTFTGNANAQGRFDLEIPLSGNGFHSLHVTNTAGGLSGPEATALFRVDCNAPVVLSAVFDRATAQVTVSFSEPMTQTSLAVGGANDSIRITDAEDATHAPQSATVSLNTTGNTATLQLPTTANAWWRNRSAQLDVRAPAADVRGNQMTSAYTTVFFVGGGGGDPSGAFLSGEAYDDESGRPLENVNAKLFTSGSSLPGTVPPASVPAPVNAATTDGRGRFAMAGSVTSGRYALVLEKAGYTRVLRRLPLDAGIGAVPFDARLTPLSAPNATALVPATGGSFDGPAGSLLKLDVAATAITTTATSLTVGLTPLSGQGLPELLPLGFTPLAAAHVRLEAAGDSMLETGASFSATGVKLTLPLPTGLDAAAQLIAVRYDLLSGSWITLPAVERSIGADGVDRAKVTLTSPGAVAVVIPDADAATRPPIPAGPNVALAGSTLPAAIPALTGTLTLNPAIVTPTGKSTAKVVARATNGTSPWPSGLAVQAYLDEKLILSSGETLFEAPFSIDLVLYHPPLTPQEQSPNTAGSVGAMSFRVSPSPKAAQVLLDSGYDNIRLFPFPDQIERGTVLGPAGGTITNDDGVELTLAEGALTSKTVVSARLLTSAELSSYPIPQGYDRLAAVRVDLSGFTLNRPATVRLNTPNGTTPDPDPRVILSAFVDQPVDGRGSFFRFVARATRAGSPEKITAAPEPTNSGLPLEGLVKEGVYFVLRAQQSIGYSTGFVKAANGFGYTGARVTATSLGTADITIPGGRYSLPVTAGAAKAVEARHPDRDERGTATIATLAANQVVQQDITITPAPPQITGFQPVNGATNQPIGSVLRVQFNKPLDPASVGQSVIKAEIANTDGTASGVYALGTAALSTDHTSIVFTPARPLPPDRTILASFTGGVRDTNGTLYAGAVPATWSFTTSKEIVYGGQVDPTKIRIFLPVNGQAQIVGAPGALPVSPGPSPWHVLVDVDGPICPAPAQADANGQGGFSVTAGCPPTNPITLDSKVWLKVFDPAGNVAEVFRLTPFTLPSGLGFVAPAGEETTFTTAEGVVVQVPATAFDRATLVTVTKLAPSTLSVPVPAGMELGAYLNVDFDGVAHDSIRLRFPVTTAAPVGSLVWVGAPAQLPWGARFQILDLGRVLDGGGGAKVISTYAVDQPADPAARARGALALASCPPDRPRCACSTLICTSLVEFTARGTAAFLTQAGAELSAISGHVEPSLITQTLSVLFNMLADAFVYLPTPHDWNGNFIIPVRAGAPFALAARSRATGWIVGQQDYQAISGASTSLIRVPEMRVTSDAPPEIIDASPISFHHFKAPLVDTAASGPCKAVQAIRLEVQACSLGASVVQAESSGIALSENSTVVLYNLTKNLRSIRATVANGTFTPAPVPADEGDSLVVVVGPGDLDPDDFQGFVFNFDRGISVTGALDDLADLKACDLGGTACAAAPAKVFLGLGGTRLVVLPAGDLARGKLFTLTLKASRISFAASTGPIAYPIFAPSEFVFATRKTATSTINTSPGPCGGSGCLLGDTNGARDLQKVGNLLMVASDAGRIVALDVSDPRSPRPFAAIKSRVDDVRTLAQDTHNRLFYSSQLSSWAVKAIRMEDVRNAGTDAHGNPVPCGPQPTWPNAIPCFEPVEGGVRTAFGLSGGVLLASEYISLRGSLPTGIPSSLEVVVQDDKEEPKELRDFYDAHKAAGGSLFENLVPDVEGIYSIPVVLDTLGHRVSRQYDNGTSSPPDYTCLGEEVYDHYQRVTIDNLTTGQSFSFDVANPRASGTVPPVYAVPPPCPDPSGGACTATGIRARRGDQLRVRYNIRTLGYLSIVGSGITVVDLNRFYRTPLPASGATQANKSECGRRMGKLEGQETILERCPTYPTSDLNAQEPPSGLAYTPALAVIPARFLTSPTTVAGRIDVYSPLTHYGGIHAVSLESNPGNLAIADSVYSCFGYASNDANSRVGVRAVAIGQGLVWEDRGLRGTYGPPNSPYYQPPPPAPVRTPVDLFQGRFTQAIVYPLPRTTRTAKSDLVFFTLGAAGVLVFDVSDRTLDKTHLIGRFHRPGASYFRVMVDEKRGRLLAGGFKGPLPIIDVWNIARVNGGPSDNASAAGEDTRLLSTLENVPWDALHIAVDESGTGLLYTWGTKYDGTALSQGGFIVPVEDPGFTYSGLFLQENQPASGPQPSIQRVTKKIVPLGVPTYANPQDELEPAKRKTSQQAATAAFRVRLAMPGNFGDELKAKVQSLRVLPDERLLADQDVGRAVALPGGKETGQPSDVWPGREVVVTLRRIGESYTTDPTDRAGESGKLATVYNLYESKEVVLLLSDPRARKAYQDTLPQLPVNGDELNQCRRCKRPDYLTPVSADVKELLAGGPYVRTFLFANGHAPTQAALDFFNLPQNKSDYRAPRGVVEVAAWADAIPSPVQASQEEPHQNAAAWSAGEAGVRVSLASGDLLLSAVDHSVPGQGLAVLVNRGYRSGSLGYGAMGAAGWHANIYAHLRQIPPIDELSYKGEVEYHDGQGNVFRFYPADPTSPTGCPAGTNTEKDPNGSYCVPKGFYHRLLQLESGKGFILFDRGSNPTYFDGAGRLTDASDRHRQGQEPDKQGSTVRFSYDGFGQLVQIADDRGRPFKLTYKKDPVADGPQYGLLLEVSDFSGRKITYTWDDDRRLKTVQLPGVTNKYFANDPTLGAVTNVPDPTLQYRYDQTTPFGNGALLHESFGQLRLTGFVLPKGRGERAHFVYDTPSGRMAEVHFPSDQTPTHSLGVKWRFGFQPLTSPVSSTGAISGADVIAPWTKVTSYQLTNGRIATLTEKNIPVVLPGELTATVKDVPTTYTYTADGRTKLVTWPDQSTTSYCYFFQGTTCADDSQSETNGSDMMKLANALETAQQPGGSGPFASPPGPISHALRVSTLFSYETASNALQQVTDPLARTIERAVASPNSSGVRSGFTAEGVSGLSSFDKRGRLSTYLTNPAARPRAPLVGSAGLIGGSAGAPPPGPQGVPTTTPVTVTYDYENLKTSDNYGRLVKVTRGPVFETYDYDSRGNRKKTATSYGAVSHADFDEWDRQVFEADGIGTLTAFPNVSGVTVKRGYDVSGHLVVDVREQDGVGSVRTTYDYNDREQLTRVTTTNVASSTPGALVTSPVTVQQSFYDPISGILGRTVSQEGTTTLYQHDQAGRVSATLKPGAGQRIQGYDIMGRLTLTGDGDTTNPTDRTNPPGYWRGKYDAWGRLFEETLPSGAVIEREHDAAGNVLRETVFEGPISPATRKLAERRMTVNSFGAPTEIRETLKPATSPTATDAVVRLTKLTYDVNGRLALEESGQDAAPPAPLRIEKWVEYEPGSGRVALEKDALGNQTVYEYDKPPAGQGAVIPAPWPTKISRKEVVPGLSGLLETAFTRIDRDALGRPLHEETQDGSTTEASYDQAGNVLSVTTAANTPSAITTSTRYDGRGNVLEKNRSGGRSTLFGYDLDGRVLTRRTAAGAPPSSSPVNETRYRYDNPTGRLLGVTHADGTTESLSYYTDDSVYQMTTRSGITLTNTYDEANRVLARVPTGPPIPTARTPFVDGGDRYQYDVLSRPTLIQRYGASAAPIDAATLAFPEYDMASRPARELVGAGTSARTPLAWSYDIFGNPTSVTLPDGVGRQPSGSFTGYGRRFDALDRLESLCGDPTGQAPCGAYSGNLGAAWSWGGTARLYGVTNRGPVKTAHRYGYVTGAVPTPVSAWRLGSLSLGAATSGATPVTGPPTDPWGQLDYGYRQADSMKLGREVKDAMATPSLSLFTAQGYTWDLDGGLRLKTAKVGRGSTTGASQNEYERFTNDYAAGDEIDTQTRDLSGKSAVNKTGAEGRITERNGLLLEYDDEGRRTKDDRFVYRWSWRGELVTLTVRAEFTGSPYAGQQLRYEYDAMGRLLSREHVGVLPPGDTDDNHRPFIEKRRYLWDGQTLLSETAYAQDLANGAPGPTRWRKSYVPGASGLDDAIQVNVEPYDAAQNPLPPALYSYLRDEQGTVTGLVAELSGANPRAPPVKVRYLYSPYGEAHAELGPEVFFTRFEPTLTTITATTGSLVTQTPNAGFQPGALRLLFSSPPDPATLGPNVFVEKLVSGAWTALPTASRAFGAEAGRPEELLVLPLNGWERTALYRIRLTSGLKDATGRSVVNPPAMTSLIPASGPPVTFDQYYVPNYESFLAAGEDVAGSFPGGQSLLFAGLWTDPVSGLAYARARWYDARTASFLEEDPAGDTDSPNRYAYVGLLPQEHTDPSGRCVGLDNVDCSEYGKEFVRGFTSWEQLKGSVKRSWSFLGSEVEGAVKAIPNAVTSAAHVVAHPKETLTGLVNLAQAVATDPAGVGRQMGQSILNADPDKVGQFVGETLLLAGLGAAAKSTEGAAAMSRLRQAVGLDEAAEGVAVGRRASARRIAEAEGELLGGAGRACRFHSFPEGTLVATETGEREIEDVRPGDRVWAYDELSASLALRPILASYLHVKDDNLAISAGGQEIVTTDEHPFFVAGKGWIEAGKLDVGDSLFGLNGELTKIESLTPRQGRLALFNFEVEADHTYFVGPNAVLVHNACSVGAGNNVRGELFERLVEHRAGRKGMNPFFANRRKGGFDLVTLEGSDVVINEAKFAKQIQFDDFSAITRNMNSNVEEVLGSLSGHTGLTRGQKGLIERTLKGYLSGASPSNLRVRVVAGKKSIGTSLQQKLIRATRLPVEVTGF